MGVDHFPFSMVRGINWDGATQLYKSGLHDYVHCVTRQKAKGQNFYIDGMVSSSGIGDSEAYDIPLRANHRSDWVILCHCGCCRR